jgi:hypothetical protein
MTYTITVELSDLEKRALEYEAYNVDEWVNHAAKQRASVAAAQIIVKNTEYCNANKIAIPIGELAQIEQAYELGIIQTAYQRQIEHKAKMKKELDALRVKESKNKNSVFNLLSSYK